jgi:hypothetical protein
MSDDALGQVLAKLTAIRHAPTAVEPRVTLS